MVWGTRAARWHGFFHEPTHSFSLFALVGLETAHRFHLRRRKNSLGLRDGSIRERSAESRGGFRIVASNRTHIACTEGTTRESLMRDGLGVADEQGQQSVGLRRPQRLIGATQPRSNLVEQIVRGGVAIKLLVLLKSFFAKQRAYPRVDILPNPVE